MSYSSKFEGKEVDKAVEAVLDEKVVVRYGNIKGNITSQADLSSVLDNKLPIDHATDDSTLPDSTEGDLIPTVPTSKAVRTYVSAKTGDFANKNLSNLSPDGIALITYKAGVGIKIDEATRTITNESPAYWGGISGALSNQTDLRDAFGHDYTKGDSIKDALDNKIDKVSGVSRREGAAVGDTITPVYVDATGMAKACSRTLPVPTSEVSEDSTKILTSGGAYTNLVSREPNSAVGSPNQPVYVTETGRVAVCSSTKTVSDPSEIKERGDDPVSAAGLLNMLEVVYPVGSIYLGVTSLCPLASFFGTWEKIATDRVLQGSSVNHGAGTTVAAGLPNITGTFEGAAQNSNHTSGAFYVTGRYTKVSNDGEKDNAYGFDASRSNSIYGNSTTVQPPAYVVNIWRRIS